MLQNLESLDFADKSLRADRKFVYAVARSSVDTHFMLCPAWDDATAKEFVRTKFAASGKLGIVHNPSAPFLCPLVGFHIVSVDLVFNLQLTVQTTNLNRLLTLLSPEASTALSKQQLAVQEVFKELLQEGGGSSMTVYHGCSADAARSIAMHGFLLTTQRDIGYYGQGFYATPNAEYACGYATRSVNEGVVVMCRACVPTAYFVTPADCVESRCTVRGKVLKKEEAHFALVSHSTNFDEACLPYEADYSELCVSQPAALCPIAILRVQRGKPM